MNPAATRSTGRWARCAVFISTLPLFVAGCRKQAPTPPPMAEVSVLTVAGQTVPSQNEWVGQAAASTGFGLLWRSPVGPLSLDLAFPLGGGKPVWLVNVGSF